jgi:hypothetical protein
MLFLKLTWDGFAAPSTLQVLYTLRDYRTEGASALEWNEVTVRSSTEIIFQVENDSKIIFQCALCILAHKVMQLKCQ